MPAATITTGCVETTRRCRTKDVHPGGWLVQARRPRLSMMAKAARIVKGRRTGMDHRTVLVVDDDAAIRELVAELLDEAGFTVLEADRGKTALDLAQEHVPSLVLVDHLLPDMSGLDLLERLRARRACRHIPVMLVSGLADRLADRDHGADSVLAKPFDINELVDRVEYFASHAQGGAA